jgi:hypothetical protein
VLVWVSLAMFSLEAYRHRRLTLQRAATPLASTPSTG